MRAVRSAYRSPALFVLAGVLVACGPSGASSIPPTAVAAQTAIATSTPRPTVTPTPTAAPLGLFPSLPTGSLDETSGAKLQAVLDSLVAAGAPDAIAAVITPGGQWTGAAGVDGPDGRKADPGDEFNIASVSKLMLAALILRLAQDGKVDLDAPISDYLGGLPLDSNGATVRQALHMRAGIGDTPSGMVDEALANCGRAWTRDEVLASIPASEGEPGGIFKYSNPTYKLLGYAAEHVTEKPLEAALDDAMFAPLDLDRILLQGATRATPKPWAMPIGSHGGALDLAKYGTGGTLPCVSVSTFSFATSAVASDASSLARWAWGLFSGALIDRAQLIELTTPFDGVHGMGIELLPNYAPDIAFGVHGGQVGYAAFLAVIPPKHQVAVLFVNYQGAEVESGVRTLLDALGR